MSGRVCVESSVIACGSAKDERRRGSSAGVLSLATMLQPSGIALTVFAVVMCAAAFEDFRRLVIPNLLPILLVALWPLYFAAAPSWYGALTSIGCALTVFFV